MKYSHPLKTLILQVFSFLILVVLITSCGPLWGTRDMLAAQQPVGASTITATSTSAPTEQPTLTKTQTLTLTSTDTITPSPSPTQKQETTTITSFTDTPGVSYYTQPGDTLTSIASHFGVKESEIMSDFPLSPSGLIDPNTLVLMPEVEIGEVSPSDQFMPDSEVIFSSSAIDFNVRNYVEAGGGYLNDYKEYLSSSGMTPGSDIVARIALENSTNPRLLLAVLEYQTGWITGPLKKQSDLDFPMGYIDQYNKGLYRQLVLVSEDISIGYYGWRSGSLTELEFTDGTNLRLAPTLNAGTVGIMYYFSLHKTYSEWLEIINPSSGFPKFYENMMGDPWMRAKAVEPLFPAGITQPTLVLPLVPEDTWSLTGGPHAAFEKRGALAALDFGPGTEHTTPCYESESWVLAAASGQVVRSGNGIVVLDLDNDGYEQTGWSILYLHIATKDRVPVGTLMNVNDKIGHPSCEGGSSTGVHFHIARKFNGEWILADGPLPFNLSGWIAHNGNEPYQGSLTRDGEIITASSTGTASSKVVRLEGE